MSLPFSHLNLYLSAQAENQQLHYKFNLVARVMKPALNSYYYKTGSIAPLLCRNHVKAGSFTIPFIMAVVLRLGPTDLTLVV